MPHGNTVWMRTRGLRGSGLRFLSAYLWLVRTHFIPNWRLVAVIVIFSGLSALAQGGIIAFIAVAVSKVENPQPVGIQWLDAILASQWLSLLFAGTALSLIAIIGTSANYAAAIRSRRLGRQFHEFCASESMARLGRLDSSSADSPLDEVAINRLVSRNGMLLGRTVEAMVRLIEPMLRLAVAVLLLVIVDARLAWVLVPLMLLLVPAIHVVGIRVKQGAERFYERSAPEMGRHVRMLVMGANGRSTGAGTDVDFVAGEDSIYRRYLDEYDGIALANERVQFLMNAANSTILGLALVVAGYLAISGSLSWPKVLVFLMALWQVQRAAIQCGNGLATLNRFYPFVAQTRAFLSHTDRTAGDPLRMPVRIRDGTDEVHVIDAGEPVCMLTDVPLERLTLRRVLAPLSQATGIPVEHWLDEVSFASDRFRISGRSIREAITEGGSSFGDVVDVFGIERDLEAMEPGLDDQLRPEDWSTLPARVRSAIAIAPLRSSPRRLLICDVRLISRLAPEACDRVIDWFEDRMLLIHCPDSSFPRRIASMFIVVDDERSLRTGDRAWFDSVVESIDFASAGSDVESAEDDAEILG